MGRLTNTKQILISIWSRTILAVREEQKPWKQLITIRWRALVLVTPRLLQAQVAKLKRIEKVKATASKEKPIPRPSIWEWRAPAALDQMINVIYFEKRRKW